VPGASVWRREFFALIVHMSSPVVSVVIPAYNSARTLPRSLSSVFSQTYGNHEVIVVDDGSTDDTEAVVRQYGERVILIRQENAGAGAARNRGASAASGRLLAFLDADDFWHRRKLELQVKAFADRSDVGICWTWHGSWREIEPDPTETELSGATTMARYSDDFASIFESPYLGTPGVMIPKDRFEKLSGFRTDLHSAEDVDLWLRAAYGSTTALIPAALFFVVATSDSLTARHGSGTYRDNIQVITEFCARHPEFAHTQQHMVRRVAAKVYEDWGSHELGVGNCKEAMGLLGMSLRNHIGMRAGYLLGKAVYCRGRAWVRLV
jgi:glycosyltransferase involved in cell wall biosynthesis